MSRAASLAGFSTSISPPNNLIVGVVTASSFVGDVTGTATGLSGTPNIVLGIATVSAGSTSAPSITPSGDDNTGVFFPSADTISASTGGVERIKVDSSGNINIDSGGVYYDAANNRLAIGSTSDPGGYNARLWVDNTTDTTFTLNTTGSTNISQIVFRNINVNGEARLMNGTGGPLTFHRSFGNEAMRLDTSGRLLVGTSSAVGASKGRIQVKGAAGGVDPFAKYVLVSGFDEEAGNISLESSGTNSISINADPDNLRADSLIAFKVDATERMRIGNNGILYSVSTSVGYSCVTTVGAGTATELFEGKYGAAAGTVASGTQSFRVWTNGNVQNTNNSYTAISDIKLKENIADANSQWDDLKALRVRNYNLKEGQTHTQIGLVAQEVEPISPGLVYESPDRDEEGNDLGTVTKSVNYSVLYMKAVKALQEAMERIEQLESEMAAVKAQLS